MLNVQELDTGSLLWLIASGCCVYAAYHTLYNLFWHPLASFPGPPVAAATSLYKAYIDLVAKSSLVHTLEKLHAKYGEQGIESLTRGPEERSFS